MYRVKETQKKNMTGWTNKTLTDYQNGTLTNGWSVSGKKTQKPEPKATPEQRAFQMRKLYLGQKTCQVPQASQSPNVYLKPGSYYDQTIYKGTQNHQGQELKQEVNCNKWHAIAQDPKFKIFTKDPSLMQGPCRTPASTKNQGFTQEDRRHPRSRRSSRTTRCPRSV
ncbi:uncharacterized protein LOC110182505 [Drosophila serrata]|uniref:uncharacterized protein LOC110182505 n=1 Tax=Drosophila serrata TaxID=7274 RepID=UPI000A1CFDFC|nr:uncharacterized protein LOC110182505 [Drosophila serrata]XP_020806215.1 uncharacterized protein LOC110182505 [Drosophila serrata]